MLSVLSASGNAQTSSAKPEAEALPLARFFPRDKLLLYVEFEGLDAHADAWRKTAAYKMLNETTLGAMLEDLSAQFLEKILSRKADRRVNGVETVKFAKHAAHAGFALGVAAYPSDPKKPYVSMVVRGVNRKDIKAITGRLILSLGDAKGKNELVKRPSGRSIVLMNGGTGGTRWGWWVEKDDLVLVPDGLKGGDDVAAILDGKYPSAVDHPIRADLVKPEDGVEPVGVAFVDSSAWPAGEPAPAPFQKLQLRGADRVDFRWGPSGDALTSILRIKAKAPRQGLLALFDQPTFDPKKLPMMVEGIKGFTAVSVTPAKAFDVLTSVAKSVDPGVGAMVDQSVEAFRARSRLQLRKDLLAHLGPKMVFYTTPAPPPSAASKGAAAKAATAEPAVARPGTPLSMALGSRPIPRAALVIDIVDKAAFERTLDTLMIVVNQELRSRAAAAAPAPAEDRNEGGAPAAKRRGESAAPEFKMMPGVAIKSYVLSVPSEVAKLPAGVRPTIRVGAKQVVIATSPELARQALEVTAASAWKPSDEFAAALEKVPSDLMVLHLDDPRDRTPQMLATLPMLLQLGINAALARTHNPAGAPGTQSMPGAAGAQSVPGAAGAPGATPGLADMPPGAAPGMATDAGAPGADAAAKANDSFTIRVDPSKLPSTDALKALMFPGTFSVSVTADEVRFVNRAAFPNMVAPMSGLAIATVGPMIQKAREAAIAKPTGTPAAGAGAAPAGPGAVSSPASKREIR